MFRKLTRHFAANVSLFNHRFISSEVSAGVIVIGDEILNGHTEDTNTPFLIRSLNSSGLKINKVCLLPDCVESIAAEVAKMSQNCTVVLTSGGIGPTHDDVTYEAVAKAYGEKLTVNQELEIVFKDYFHSSASENPAVLKFSSVPQSARLNYGTDKDGNQTKFPIISVKNVYMLPGVPMLLQRGFEVFKSNFLLCNQTPYLKNIFLNVSEFNITAILNEAVRLFKNDVKFGSYPTFNANYYKVKIVIEGLDEKKVNQACSYLEKKLPKGSIVNLKEKPLSSAVDDLKKLSEKNPAISKAISVTKEALHKYSLSEMCICFNGGKDCTVLLHLLYCCVLDTNHDWRKVHTLYVRGDEPFQEIEDFIKSCVKYYNLNLVMMTGSLKGSFSDFLKENPHIKAIFMGTRKTDPGSGTLDHFSPTDTEWPPAIRVLPILHWSYTDVWHFVRELQVPYCTLYDQGYTSVGLKTETKKNPALLIPTGEGFRTYRPAYLLNDDTSERKGRK